MHSLVPHRLHQRAGYALIALAASAAWLAMATNAWAAKDETFLISRLGAVGADAYSVNPAISADGRFVAFSSVADNLSGDDADGVADVFVRDTQTNTTTLVSRVANTPGDGGDAQSVLPSVSADGRYVAFQSDADNLSTDDNNGLANVFVRDTQTNTTTLVSRVANTPGDGATAGDSLGSTISADGRYVAFHSYADNLSTDDVDPVIDVFVRDTQSNTTTLVSREANVANDGGENNSVDPSISADGRYVAFHSDADNLSTNDDNAVRNVFVRDTQTNTTTLVSRVANTPGDGGDGLSVAASISADGRYVAFDSDADNLSPDDDNSVNDVFLRDTQLNTTTLVSRVANTPGDGGTGGSNSPSVSADARYVAFQSTANNLSGDDADGVTDVFLRDTQTNTTTLVSRVANAPLDGGDDNSDEAFVSADGRFVAFTSLATNLSPDDDNSPFLTNVFLRDVLGPPPGPPPPPPAVPAAVPPPVVAQSIVVAPVSGDVLVKVPGGKFVPLSQLKNIPVGSIIDARKGRVRLTAAAAAGASARSGAAAAPKTQTMDFFEGIFKVNQKRAAKPVTEAQLVSGDFSVCKGKARKGGVLATAARSKRKVRRLWGSGKGRFRTKGKHSAGTVRGTTWLTQDRCDGTLTKVQKGKVSVRDFRRKKTVTVKARHSYLARAR